MMLLTVSAYAQSATTTLQEMYAQAELLMATGDYSGAAGKFDALGAYADASQMAMYCKAVAAAETLGMYDVAVSAFNDLGNFKDSKQMSTYYTARRYQAVGDSFDVSTASDSELELAKFSYDKGTETYAGLALFKDCLTRMSECQTRSKAVEAEQNVRAAAKLEAAYQAAVALEESGEFQKAINAFKKIQDYKDSKSHITACENAIKEGIYQEALALKQNGEFQKAIDTFRKIRDYKDSKAHITACENAIKEGIYQDALALEESGEYQKAIDTFKQIQDYKDSKAHITACENGIKEGIYQEAVAFEQGKEYSQAIDIYSKLKGYKDSEERIKDIYRQLYRKADSKRISEYPLYGGFTLGMSHKSFLETAKKAGFTTKWIPNNQAVKAGTWGYKYWDQNCSLKELGDFSIQLYFKNKNGEMADSDTILCLEYDFGSYGTKGSQTINEAKDRFVKLNKWLTAQFGKELISNSAINNLVLLPSEYHFVKPGFEYMNDSLPCSMWIIPLSDGSVMSVTNIIVKSYGIQNQIYFMLYDSATVDEILK